MSAQRFRAIGVLAVLLASGPTHASTLCFDILGDVQDAQGASCCATDTQQAAGARCAGLAWQCDFVGSCELAIRVDSPFVVLPDTTLSAMFALVWDHHACCAPGTLTPRPAAEVTPFSPQTLRCQLLAGCDVELVHADKPSHDAAEVELGVSTMPWSAEHWDMFRICHQQTALGVAGCMQNWLLQGCDATICKPAYRQRLLRWLEKVTVAAGNGEPGSYKAPVATLFSTQSGACCVAGTSRDGPFVIGGRLLTTACQYDVACVPSEGDVLVYGDDALLLSKGAAWQQLPATCVAEQGLLDQVDGLQLRIADAEAAAASVRDQLQAELNTCDSALQASRDGGGCDPATLAEADVLVIEGPSSELDLLANDGREGARLLSVSPPNHAIGVWRADGTFAYYPNPGFAGQEILTYQAVDADGQLFTGTVTVTVP